MSELELRTAWQRHDPTIERDAERFWRANRALPQGVDTGTRLSELCAAAYCGNEMVAVSTASIRMMDFLRCKLAMFRVLVGREMRVNDVASRLAVFSRDLLETWSKENPDQAVMGLGAVIQSRVLVKNIPEAVYPDTKLAFIGYTQEGFQMRVYWFAHATISNNWPGDESNAMAEKESTR
jgi:hypothetical protein